MELKEMIKVMTHYLNGGDVECCVKGEDNWETFLSYYWNWYRMDYRIKEEKQKVAIEKWLMKDASNGEYFIYESSRVDLYLKETFSTKIDSL